MTPTRIKRHRKRKGGGDAGNMHMTLVPFIDMLMILTVFLLVHISDVDILPNTKSISIPASLSDKKPRPTVVVMITKDDLLVDGRSVATLAQIEASQTLTTTTPRDLFAVMAPLFRMKGASSFVAVAPVSVCE